MMPMLTKEDIELIRETKKWLYKANDGRFHLRNDAPKKIKEHYEKMDKLLPNDDE